MIDQLADLTATLLANVPEPGAANWRFGAFGLVLSRVSVFLLADVMLFGAAIGLQHKKSLRVLGILHLFLAPILLAGLGLFVLDWLQVRRVMMDRGASSFDLAGLRAATLALLAALLAARGGLAAYRAGRTHHKGGHHEAEAPPVLTGSRPGKAKS